MLQGSRDPTYLILVFIGCIMIGGLLYDGGRMVYDAANPSVQAERRWQPFSTLMSMLPALALLIVALTLYMRKGVG